MLSKQEIFKKLFEGENYNSKKLQNLIFDLTKSAEYFLAHCTLHEDELEFLLNLSKGFHNKNLPGESNRINKSIEEKLQPSFSPDKDYISKLKRLTYLKYAYYNEHRDFDGITKCIEDIFEASALQFIFEYINIISNMKIGRNEYGMKIENKFIQNILQNIDLEKLLSPLEKENYVNNPYIGLHYYRFKTIEEPDNLNYYYLLKDLLFKNLSSLNREEKWFFFINLANYCVQKMARNVEGFDEEGLNIYKSMFENDAYSSSGIQYMDVMTWRNVIHLCNFQKDIKWLHYFVKKYINCLHTKHRDSLEHFAYASLHFMKKEFEKSLEHISMINIELSFLKTDVKGLYLKVYYELNYFEQAFSGIDAFKHFINSNNEITDAYKNPYRAYIKLYEELIKIKSGKSKKEPAVVKAKIEKETYNVLKPWLIEKAEELIRKMKSYDIPH
jgi:hypothetical protein